MPEFGEINFEFDKPLTFDVTLEVKPEFEIKDYKGLEVKKKSSKATSKVVDEEIERLSFQKANFVAVKKGSSAKRGDLLVCDIKVEVDGKVVKQDDEVELSCSTGSVINLNVPDLEKSLSGAKCDDEVSIDLKLDDDFEISECKGKDAVLKLAIKDIKRATPPKIDDELAKQFGCDSLEDLKDKVEFALEAQLKAEAEQDIYSQIADKLLQMADFEVPTGIINSMASERIDKYKAALLQKGEALDKVDELAEKSKNESEEAVIKEFKLSLILENIATKERIYITDSEVDKRVETYARNYNISTEQMYKYLEKMENLRTMRHQMREEKTLAYLSKEAKVSDSTEKAIETKTKETKETKSAKSKTGKTDG